MIITIIATTATMTITGNTSTMTITGNTSTSRERICTLSI